MRIENDFNRSAFAPLARFDLCVSVCYNGLMRPLSPLSVDVVGVVYFVYIPHLTNPFKMCAYPIGFGCSSGHSEQWHKKKTMKSARIFNATGQRQTANRMENNAQNC